MGGRRRPLRASWRPIRCGLAGRRCQAPQPLSCPGRPRRRIRIIPAAGAKRQRSGDCHPNDPGPGRDHAWREKTGASPWRPSSPSSGRTPSSSGSSPSSASPGSGCDQHLVDDQARRSRGPPSRCCGDLRVLLQVRLGVLAALADAVAVVGDPSPRLLDDPGLDAEIDQLADLGDAFAVHDVELDLLERRGDLVLDHLDARLRCRRPRRAP